MRIRWFGQLVYMEATREERKNIRECYAWSRYGVIERFVHNET